MNLSPARGGATRTKETTANATYDDNIVTLDQLERRGRWVLPHDRNSVGGSVTVANRQFNRQHFVT
jgi:hypothetical protein